MATTPATLEEGLDPAPGPRPAARWRPLPPPLWRLVPWATLALIALTLGVFWGPQRSEAVALDKARQFYLQHEVLPVLELPAYVSWLEQQQRPAASALRQALREGGREAVLDALMQDAPFERLLRAGSVIAPTHPQYMPWLNARIAFEDLEPPPFAARWGQDHHPGVAQDWVSWITSAFLHGSGSRLAINMLFLLLFGAVLERTLGPLPFTGLYLLGATGASTLDAWFHSDTGGLDMGAGGAISALLGAYLVLWSHGRLRMPGPATRHWTVLIVLPLSWLWARLLLQMHGDTDRGLVADLGGLLTGALVMLLVMALRRIDAPDDLARQAGPGRDAPQLLAEHAAQVAAARRLTGELKFEQAAAAWRAAAKLRPRDAETLRQWFNLAKLWPAEKDFHRCARLIFALPGDDAYTLTLQHASFRTYVELAKPSARLRATTLARLVRRFTRGGEFADADRLCRAFVRKAPTHPQLPATLAFYLRGLLRAGRHTEARAWLPHLIQLTPDSPLVREIQES